MQSNAHGFIIGFDLCENIGIIKIKLCGCAGCAVTVARVTPEVKRGTVFVPYQELSQMQAMRGADDARFLAVRVETEVA